MGLALQEHSAHTCNACMCEVVHCMTVRSKGAVVEPVPKCMLTFATFFSHLAHTMQPKVRLL